MKKQVHKLLTEPFVQKAVRKYLRNAGFGTDLTNTAPTAHGVDIKVKNRDFGRYFLVECKGDPSVEAKSHGGGWRSSALNSALGQIISRMHTHKQSLYGGYNYGVAFPISFEKIALRKIPYYVCKRLMLSIFLVGQKGTVEKYNHIRLKKIQ